MLFKSFTSQVFRAGRFNVVPRVSPLPAPLERERREYKNIPQDNALQTLCSAYENFHNNNPPIPSHHLKKMLGLILKENSFEFKVENYLQTPWTALGRKIVVAFANIFMTEIETNVLNQSRIRPIAWRRYIDDVFSLWDTKGEDLDIFITQVNKYYPTIKFTVEISDNEIAFLDTVVYKGVRFETELILDIKTHYKPTETFQCTHYTSCPPPLPLPPRVKRGFIKGEAIRLLRTNSSETHF